MKPVRYRQGDYQILLFGEYGEKIKTKISKTFLSAAAKADKHTAKNPRYSAVVNRTITNSLNQDTKWSYNS